MAALSTFPSTNSIPPSSFFDREGLTGWLNTNPSYKQYFVNFPKYFPTLLTTSTVSEYVSTAQSDGSFLIYQTYKIENVPVSPFVTMMSSAQSQTYQDHLRLFRQVYGHNSNAYVQYLDTGIPPVYYRFPTSNELTKYKMASGEVGKLYPFDVMTSAKNEAGQSLGWIFPFPI